MPNKFYLLLAGLLLFTSTSIAHAREWQDKTGKFRIEAKFVSCKDNKVYLEKADGSVISVPIETLCYADYDFLRTLPEMREFLQKNMLPTEHTFYYIPKIASEVTGIVFSPDGHWLAVATLYEIQMLDLQKDAPVELKSKFGRENFGELYFSADGKQLISASRYTVFPLTVWQVNDNGSLKELRKLTTDVTRGQIASLTFFNGGKRLLIGTQLHTLSCFDLEQGKMIIQFENNFEGDVDGCFVNPKATQALASDGKFAILFDLIQNKPLQKMALNDTPIYRSAVSPDGRQIAASTTSEAVRFWNTVSGEISGDITPKGNGPIWSVRYSASGKYLMIGRTRSVDVWDVQNQRHVVNLQTSGDVYAKIFAMSTDDQFLAIASKIYIHNTLQVFKIPDSSN